MISEKWVPITESTGNYEVSNLGQVRNARTGQMLNPRQTPHGYLRVHLPCNVGRRDFYIHRLVAEAFCDHPSGSDVVNHIDNNPANNAADNLEWTTQRGNVMHAMKQGRVPKFPNAKAIIGTRDGIRYRFSSIHEAAEFSGCDHKSIYHALKKLKTMRNGFRWEVV